MKAAVDIGTNTLRMLIGTVVEGKVRVAGQFIEETRLGAGIAQRRLFPAAVDRSLQALERFKETARAYGATEVAAVATSAVRDAVNGEDFVRQAFALTGWPIEILSGEEEALLSFSGAVAALPILPGLPAVVDIGGGSTELIFRPGAQVIASSVNVGAVRLKETGLSPDQLRNLLDPAVQPILCAGEKISLVGVGGTVTTAAAVHRGVEKYTREAVHGQSLSRDDLIGIRDRLEEMTLRERKNVPGLPPKRADIILPGITIMLVLLEMLHAPGVTVSDAGILDGLLLRG